MYTILRKEDNGINRKVENFDIINSTLTESIHKEFYNIKTIPKAE